MDISIVIPTHNRKEKLRQCLDSLFRQDYPQDNFEIIVIDDGSKDKTAVMLTELLKEHPNLRYFSQEHKGPAAARNIGIKEARADIVGFTDNDCILDKDWIRKMMEAHRLSDNVIAIGGLTSIDPNNIKAAVSQFLSDGAIKTKIHKEEKTIFFPTCNVSLKKNYLNGETFDETFLLPAGEDLEFFWRIFKKGHNFIYKADIEIFHDCHTNFKSFLKQAYMYGRGNYLVQHLHQDHILLKEIYTKNNPAFLKGLIINFVKIPRFAYYLGKRLIVSSQKVGLYAKFRIYVYFILHKIFYLFGNIAERRRVIKLQKNTLLKKPEKADAVFSKPEFIILDITHRCNLKCNICEIRKDRPKEEFTTDEVKDLIIQAINWGVKEFVLSGGEPFVRDDIFEILDFVKDNDYHIGILSNGIVLNDGFLNKLLPYLTCDALSLSISLDSLTPEIHDEIRGTKGCFEKTMNGMERISELKMDHPNINFNVISIILNENLEGLIPLANFLKSLKVNSLQFQPLLVNNLIMAERTSKVKYWIPQERLPVLDKTIDSLIEFKKHNSRFVRNSENNLYLNKKYFRGLLTNIEVNCQYATKTMLIANNGDVTTCFDCYGNIRKNRLRMIYGSEKAQQARKRVKACKSPCLLPCFCD